MSERSHDEMLSAAVDGEAAAPELDALCGAWRSSGSLRSRWHAYHLIGDVLRSEELAASPGHDERFLRSLRERLADEPVVLAPVRSRHGEPGAQGVLRRWATPAAVAAGFMAVAGALLITRGVDPGATGGPQLAAAPAVPAGVQQVSLPQGPEAAMADGKLIRDARLDRYLAAHKQFGGASGLAVPGMVLRSSTTVAPDR